MDFPLTDREIATICGVSERTIRADITLIFGSEKPPDRKCQDETQRNHAFAQLFLGERGLPEEQLPVKDALIVALKPTFGEMAAVVRVLLHQTRNLLARVEELEGPNPKHGLRKPIEALHLAPRTTAALTANHVSHVMILKGLTERQVLGFLRAQHGGKWFRTEKADLQEIREALAELGLTLSTDDT
ncbi:MAG: hypothetical protein AAB473_00825 [Patescibacteria group bacterium]